MGSTDERQPNGAPPEEWFPRTDAGARKLIDRIDGLSAELDGIQNKLEGLVSHKWLISVIGAAAVTIVGGAYVVAKNASDRAEQAAKEAKADVRQVRHEMADKVAGMQTAMDAVYKVTVEGLSARAARREAEKAREAK